MTYAIPIHSTTGKFKRFIMAKKKKKDVIREPNGRASRRKNPQEARSAPDTEAIKIRQQMFGLTEKEARDQKAGTFIGRLQLAHERNKMDPNSISLAQYHAAMKFLEIYNQYSKVIASPAAIYEPVEGLASSMTESEWREKNERVKARYNGISLALYEKQQSLRIGHLWASLMHCVVRDESHIQIIGDLRVALNALVDYFNGGMKRN
jgi:hypothetical protein